MFFPVNNNNKLEGEGGIHWSLLVFKTNMTEVDSPKQVNGYDCGIYILMYARMLANDIVKGKYPTMIDIMPAEVTECRRVLQQRITKEKEIIEKDKRTNKTESDKNSKINNK